MDEKNSNHADVLRPGTQVDLVVTSGGRIQIITSRLMHMVEEALYLVVPMQRDPLTLFASGQSITILVKPKNALYEATTRVLGWTKRGPLRLVIERPAELKRVERRRDPRVPVHIRPDQCKVHFSQSAQWIGIDPTIINISVGGVLLQHNQLLVKDSPVKMTFRLPDDYGSVQVEGRVVHSRVSRQTDPPTYLMGVMFTQITPEDSAAILRFTLNQ